MVDENGVVRVDGTVTFTDPMNQPSVSRTVTIAHAQILTLSSTAVVLVPATETLGYSGTPTQIIVPVSVVYVIDTLAGVYTNVDNTSGMALFWGSAGDYPLIVDASGTLIGSLGYQVWAPGSLSLALDALPNVAGNLGDNALAIGLSSNLGNVTGGNVANSMHVSVTYTVAKVK